jgi:hypothetical protein
MYKVDVVLVVTAPDIVHPAKTGFLVEQLAITSLPRECLYKDDIDTTAKNLLYKLLHINGRTSKDMIGWVDIIQVSAFQNNPDKLSIAYGCMIPEPVKPKMTNHLWITHQECAEHLSELDMRILQKVCQNL